jgi:hypothetical protein
MHKRDYKLGTCIAIMSLSLIAAVGRAQSAAAPTFDMQIAPRSSMLTGTAKQGSESGLYVITLPPPNECLIVKPIAASSRSAALYHWVSSGGFSLLPSTAGLTVWTIEEYKEATATLGRQWYVDKAKRCEAKKEVKK